jgi:hypothetical protein
VIEDGFTLPLKFAWLQSCFIGETQTKQGIDMSPTVQMLCLGAVADAVGLPDGQRGVSYYLTEARALIARGDHGFALSALEDALKQDDCCRRQWARIMRAIRFTRKAMGNV